MTPLPIAASSRLYLRPAGFVDSPIGLDGQVERLAGGLCFFSAYEVIAEQDGAIRRWLVPVGAMGQAIPSAHQDRANAVQARLTSPRDPLSLGRRIVRLDEPQLAGIVNVTPDSFSDGGRFHKAMGPDVEAATLAGHGLAEEGAAIIDVGGESTRPDATPVWEQDEAARVIPVIGKLAAAGVAVSIDSRRAFVIEAALAAGAGMINDVSGLCHDPHSLALALTGTWPVVIMHSPDPAHSLHGREDRVRAPSPLHMVLQVYDWLESRIETLAAAGLARSRIVADPGIGFGTTLGENVALINHLSLFHGLGVPIMLGASRKRMIGALSREEPAEDRLAGSIALALAGVTQGVQLLRVHDVKATRQALRVWRGLRDGALAGG